MLSFIIQPRYRVSYWNRCTPYHTHDTRTLNAINLHNRQVHLWTRLGIQGHFKAHTHSKNISVSARGAKTVVRNEIFMIPEFFCLQKNICQQNLLFSLKSFSCQNSISSKRYNKTYFGSKNRWNFFHFFDALFAEATSGGNIAQKLLGG